MLEDNVNPNPPNTRINVLVHTYFNAVNCAPA